MDDLEYAMLRATWFPVARSEDVGLSPVAGRLLDVDLVIFRTGLTVTVAGAYCPHRGAKLSMGRVESGQLECPYHGWRFRSGDGRCVLVPSLPPGSSPAPARLKTYPAREAYGHIWSALEEPFLPIPSIPDLDDLDGWQVRAGTPHDLTCGMRQLTENFRDMSHFPFVHYVSMGPNVARVVPPYKAQRNDWDVIWTVPADLGGTAFDGNQAVASKHTMTYHLTLPSCARIRTEFPDGGRRYTIQFATPLDRHGELTRQFYLVAIDGTVATKHGVSIDRMYRYETQVFEEDWPIVENQMPREAPLDEKSQAHTRADKFSILYRRTYRELLVAFAGSRSEYAPKFG
jgi:phenylpropionate dioxygenase-like ring-hydroxylating dioxygenase large terminal subunit